MARRSVRATLAATAFAVIGAALLAGARGQLAAQAGDHQPIRELVAWIAENLDADLSVPALARRAAMSARNFSRIFTQQVNETPARFVARLRTEAAQSKLIASNGNVETIALDVGFRDGETLRRRLRSEVGVSPMNYRAQSRRAATRMMASIPSSEA